MTQDQKNTGKGGHPTGEMKSKSLADSSSVAGALQSDIDNLHRAPQPLQATHAPSPHPCDTAPPIAAPVAPQSAQWGNLPQYLRGRKQWCIAAPNKSPFSPAGFNASVNDPNQWTDWYSASTAAASWGNGAGIGYVICDSDGVSCIDLDIKDADTHPDKSEVWTTDADRARYERIVEAFDSYTERSRSGKGYHIWVRGKVEGGAKRDGVEVYSNQRFIICTGNVVRGGELQERQELLDMLYAEIRAAQGGQVGRVFELEEVANTDTDDAVYERAQAAGNGAKFVALWTTPYSASAEHPSQSEADLALMSMLAFHSKSNEQCRRLFRLSELGKREKATKNNRYLDYTLKLIRARQAREQAALAVDEQRGVKLAANMMAKMQPKVEVSSIEWPPGFAGELAKFIYRCSYLPVREVSIATTLGFLAGVCGRAYTISEKPTSLYVILVARSAIGKDAMHEGIHKLIKLAAIPGSERFIHGSDFASGPALHKALLREPGFLYLAGEFGRKLKRMASPTDTPMQDLRTTMTDAWNKDYLSGKEYSKAEDSMDGVTRPALSFLGETTPNTFYESLTQDMLSDGFMSRFLVIEYQGDRPHANSNRVFELAAKDLFRLQELLRKAMPYQDAVNSPAPSIVLYQSGDAKEKLVRFELECADEIRAAGDDESQRMMWNRGHIKALQIASLLAIADDPEHAKIDHGHATWAIALVRKDISVFKSKLQGGEIGSGDHARESRLHSLIQHYFDAPVAASHKIPAGMKEAAIIPRRYFQNSTSKTTSFVNHAGGAPGALKVTLNTLVENGALIVVPKDRMRHEWGAQGTCYLVTDKSFG